MDLAPGNELRRHRADRPRKWTSESLPALTYSLLELAIYSDKRNTKTQYSQNFALRLSVLPLKISSNVNKI